jgi:Pyruvate/2-oxoacid:ferredoxin oxidoreductase gamma subunit
MGIDKGEFDRVVDWVVAGPGGAGIGSAAERVSDTASGA